MHYCPDQAQGVATYRTHARLRQRSRCCDGPYARHPYALDKNTPGMARSFLAFKPERERAQMKRDFDLCRKILEALEAHPEPLHHGEPKIEGRRQGELVYHLYGLCDAGLVWSEFRQIQSHPMDAELARMSSKYISIQQGTDSYRLTWAGHEFLEAARDNTVWNNAKRKVLDTTGGLAFEFLRAVLMHKGKELLGLE